MRPAFERSFAGSAGRRANGRSETSCLAVWAAGRGPDPSFTAMVFWLCETVLFERSFDGSAGRRANGRSALVSRQFRKQRLAVWAAGRGPDPHFTAMVFWLCETVL